ncbi:ABC transporter ATP-binding protein [Candidatus Parcubacteria bacterium]|jgi:putative ABC transport system ATP-binding protein|nr:MAG: ABC transporter ATP-binding protein [Candidatus Parcubacteria bacterium]
MSRTLIQAKNLRKKYQMSKTNIVQALDGVDIEVQEGDFSAIVGPSGCGKSTLLHILGLLDKLDEGEYNLDGLDTTKIREKDANQIRAKKIGFIFQGFNLIPSLTALENIMQAGKYGGLNARQRKERAEELLDVMGLQERKKHKPNELSGGQQQRVAIARALVNKPAIILADEPTGELDSATSKDIIDLLKKLNQENNQTFLMVTHNMEVAEMCKKIIRLKDGRNA